MKIWSLLFCISGLFIHSNVFIGMELPVASNNSTIGKLDNIEFQLNIKKTNNSKQTLLVDAISPFDLTPTTTSRKPLGKLNGQLQITGEHLVFDKVNNKYNAAFQIHPEEKNEGPVIILGIDTTKKNLQLSLYNLKEISSSHIKNEIIQINPTPNKLLVLNLLLTLTNNDWEKTTITVTQSEKAYPSITPSNIPAKSKNPKWKFWRK